MLLGMENLVKLQGMDSEILELQKFVSVSPEDLMQKEKRLEELHASLSTLETQLKDAKTEIASVTIDLESSQALFDAAEVKKGNVHNSKEYEAALREIDALSTTIDTLSTRSKELTTTINTLTEELSGFDGEKGTLQNEVDAAREAYEKGVAKSQSRLDKVQLERDKFVESIPKPVLSKYNRLMQKHSCAVVLLEGEFCSGCSIQLPPQSVVEIRRGNSVTKCLNCGCFIYCNPDDAK